MKISIEDSIYPKQLKKIKRPPKHLYLEGNIKLLETVGIAIIGSRKCTKYGEMIANKFSKELCLRGVTIISGMAKGIDTFAHIGSIETTGNTIAVLPSGLKNIYPKENIDLYNKILKNNGLILTEYDDNVEGISKRFLERNRIVSGLSIGILVIEGGYRSGTSFTAKLAKEQDKKVFCIPSSLENPKGITPNNLIKDGAFLVTDVKDIINKYPHLNFKKKYLKKVKQEENLISDEYKIIYDVLDKEKEIHINDIARISKLNINEVNYKLMMLELDGRIESLPGNNFIRK